CGADSGVGPSVAMLHASSSLRVMPRNATSFSSMTLTRAPKSLVRIADLLGGQPCAEGREVFVAQLHLGHRTSRRRSRQRPLEQHEAAGCPLREAHRGASVTLTASQPLAPSSFRVRSN